METVLTARCYCNDDLQLYSFYILSTFSTIFSMAHEDSSGSKLAEALLRFSSSTLNYDVIPPPPSDPNSERPRSTRKGHYYAADRLGHTVSSLRRAAELAGYSLINAAPISSGYSEIQSSNVEASRRVPHTDYYISSAYSSSSAASSGSTPVDAKLVARLLAERLAQDMHLNRDFNKDYQSLMELAESKSDDLSVLTELRLLTKEFLDTAQSVGCIIIDELFEPQKTIPPVDIGGIAGGVKYVYRNILYKICLDTELDENRGWMHGGSQPSHEKAMKTGAHELRGIMHYSSLRVSGLHFPLMLVMDYKGFRLVAEALLPINKETICYGSSDGGETVHASGENLCLMMKTVGQELHLAPHLVKNKMLYGPGDQEVHLGLDGRYYCLDLARVFPCEPARHHLTSASASKSPSPALPSARRASSVSSSPVPNSSPLRFSSRNLNDEQSKAPGPTPVADEPRSIFYKFFRPEFILSYKKPLACDCFTAWGKSDPMFAANNKDIIDAFQYLRSFTIPKFADLLDKKVIQLPRQTDAYQWWSKEKPLEQMHAMGVNIRHLGLVRSHCVSEFARRMILNEMLARTMKNLIRHHLREETQAQTRLSHEVVKDIVIAYYNWALGKGPKPTSSDVSSSNLYDASSSSPGSLGSDNGVLNELSSPTFDPNDDVLLNVSVNTDLSIPSIESMGIASEKVPSKGPVPFFPASTVPPSMFNSGIREAASSSQASSQTHLASLTSQQQYLNSSSSSDEILPESTTSLNSSSSFINPEIAATAFPDESLFTQFYYQFESSLNRDEVKDPRKAIMTQLDRKMFFGRLNQMLGIEMDKEAEKELHHTTSYEFVHCDISSIAPRVRFMNLVDESEGLALYITAKQKRSDQRKRLLSLSTAKLKASCVSLPHNFRGLFYWGRTLYEEAKVATSRDVKIKTFEDALEKLRLVSKLRPLFAESWVFQVRIWLKLFELPEYQAKIGDFRNADPTAEDFAHLTDSLHDACVRLIRLDLLWSSKLLRYARPLFTKAFQRTVEPTSVLKIVREICLAIQEVCAPMLDAYPSVPLPPDAINIRLPRIYGESLLICARSLRLRSRLASERAEAAKPDPRSTSAQQIGINHDELHSKRLRFQLSEQIGAIIALPHFDDAAYFDRLLIDAMSDISYLIKGSNHLVQAFQQRCRIMSQASLVVGTTANSITAPFSPYLAPFFPLLDFTSYDVSWSTMRSPGGNLNEAFAAFFELAAPHVGPKLTSIDLSGCKMVTLASLNLILERSTKTLTALDISDLPCITNSWLSSSTAKIENLQYLSVRQLKISDDTAATLCSRHGTTLKRLDISYNSISNLGLYRMARELKCLEALDVSGNIGIGARTLVSLESADVGSGPVPRTPKTDSMFSDAMTLLRPSLEALSLLECYSLSNQAVWDIATKLRQLHTLSLATKQITDQYLLKLEPLMPQMQALSLKGLSNSDAAVSQLLSHLGPMCRDLSLRACMGIADDSIKCLDKCTNLKTLHIGLCIEIQGSSFDHLSQHIHSITNLDVAGLRVPSTGSLARFVNAQKELISLSISAMASVLNDASLISILANSSKVRYLNVSGNPHITVRSLERLPVLTPGIEGLNLADCHGLRNIEPSICRLKNLMYLNARYAHPQRNHCLLESRFSHIPFLVLCQCDKGKPPPAPTPSISSTLEKEISSKVALAE